MAKLLRQSVPVLAQMVGTVALMLHAFGIIGTAEHLPAPAAPAPVFVPDAGPNDPGGAVPPATRQGDARVVPVASFTWGRVTGTVYYNRSETRQLRSAAYASTVAAGLCAAFGAETFGASCAIGAAVFSQWTYVAEHAYSAHACVKIKVPTFWAYQYKDKRCR